MSYSAVNISVLVGICTLCAVQEFNFVSTCSNKVIHKKIVDLCHGFHSSWFLPRGSSVFPNAASISYCSRESVSASFVPCCCAMVLCPQCFQVRLRDKNTARGSVDRLVWKPNKNFAVPCQGCSTSAGGIIHAICMFLHLCSNMWWMTCFGWQLTHDITVHFTRLSLKKSCFEINVEKIPTFAGCHLATHPELLVLWKQEKQSVW